MIYLVQRVIVEVLNNGDLSIGTKQCDSAVANMGQRTWSFLVRP